MMTLSNNSGQMGKSHKPDRKRICSRLLVLVGLAAMILTCFCLLPGCGSDNKSQAISGKKEKTAASSTAMKSQAVLPMQNLGEVSKGNVKKEPLSPDTELAPGLTVREVEKREEANRKRAENPNYEVIKGINKKELDNKLAAEQKRQESTNSVNLEILPGITKKDLDARMAAHFKMAGSGNGGLSGITKEELNSRMEVDRIKRELNHEVLPGVFKDKLDKKLREAAKQ